MYLKEVLFILELKKITLADRPLFESYLSRPDQRGSECAFTNLFVWQDCYGIYWTVVHDQGETQRSGFLFAAFWR